MSTLYGANPDQLEHLGTTLKRQIEAINSVMSTVTSALSGTTWMGPARDQFEQEWLHGPLGSSYWCADQDFSR